MMTRLIAHVGIIVGVTTTARASGTVRGASHKELKLDTLRAFSFDKIKRNGYIEEPPQAVESASIDEVSKAAVEGANYLHVGCYNYQGTEDSWFYPGHSKKMTLELCSAHCTPAGARYMGLLVGDLCFCGEEGRIEGYIQGGEGICDSSCVGDDDQLCGGTSTFDLYYLQSSETPPTLADPKDSSKGPLTTSATSSSQVAINAAGSTVASPSDMNRLLELHNSIRCIHNAGLLDYSEELESTAKAHAEYLTSSEFCGQLFHSKGSGYGENIFLCKTTAASGDCFTPELAMHEFYDKEVSDRSVKDYGGHATQIVWKGTEALGCAVEACEADGSRYNVLVCNYDPAGNRVGQYEQEVEQPSKEENDCGYD